MPIVVKELADSPEWGAGPSVTRHYVITGTSSDQLAMAALKGGAPGYYGGFKRDDPNITLEPTWQDSNADRGEWRGDVQYISEDAIIAETGDVAQQFDTTGGTHRIKQAPEHIESYAATDQTKSDHKGAIGVVHLRGGGVEVQGVDVGLRMYAFSETHYLPDQVVTLTYRNRLYYLTKTVNNAPFRGTKAGESLFLGAAGGKRAIGDWEINFRFAGSPNTADIRTEMPSLTALGFAAIPKKGWEYIWFEYGYKDDAPSARILVEPTHAHVERVYPYCNFGELGI